MPLLSELTSQFCGNNKYSIIIQLGTSLIELALAGQNCIFVLNEIIKINLVTISVTGLCFTS